MTEEQALAPCLIHKACQLQMRLSGDPKTRAKRLLERTDLSVGAIAAACGLTARQVEIQRSGLCT